MKEYEKRYEDVFSVERSLTNPYNIEKVKARNGLEINEYIDIFKNEIKEQHKVWFEHAVKVYWLISNFNYDNRDKEMHKSSGIHVDKAYSRFLLESINCNSKALRHGMRVINLIATYFTDLFPDLLEGNPFETTFEFPYKHITIDYLVFVYRMDERLDLLQLAEDRKMGLVEFYDYVINHIGCVNEEVDEEKYYLIKSRAFPEYIGTKK